MVKYKKTLASTFLATLAFISLSSVANAEENLNDLSPAKPDSQVFWETDPYITDLREASKPKLRILGNDPNIVDISKWQGTIDWAKASKHLDMLIIRTQHGSSLEDSKHVEYERNANAYKIPFGVYSYSQAISTADARIEAKDFYNRADKNAQFYVIDVEELTSKSGESMRDIINAYVDELRKYTDKQVGLYIAHHLYKTLNLDVAKSDFVWIPRYGIYKPAYDYQIWQYTDSGVIDGIPSKVDMNKLADGLTINNFLKKSSLGSNNNNTVIEDDKKEDVVQVKDEIDLSNYFTTNPRMISNKVNITEYSSTTFNDSTKVKSIAKNSLLKIVGIKKPSSGIPRLILENGNYITSNKDYILKMTSNLDEYYTYNPTKIVTITNNKTYTSKNLTTESDSIKANKVITVSELQYNVDGVPVFKLSDGSFIEAKKSAIYPVITTIENFYTTKLANIVTKDSLYSYSDSSLTKVAKKYAKGSALKVESISYVPTSTEAYAPVFKLKGSNEYVTTSKLSVNKLRSDYANYHLTLKKGLVTSDLYKYTTTDFIASNKGNKVSKNTVITPKGIVFTDGGTPRILLSSGNFISANKANVLSVPKKIKDYYYTNPSKVKVLSDSISVYSSTNFNSKTKVSSLAKNKTVKVLAIEFTDTNYPRLKIGNNKYISANKKYISKIK